jgi:plasmid stabilization system protein ParE
MAHVFKREAAKRDLIRHFVYLAENASLEVPRRFKDAARDTFIELSEMPEDGLTGKGSPGQVRQCPFVAGRRFRAIPHRLSRSQ